MFMHTFACFKYYIKKIQQLNIPFHYCVSIFLYSSDLLWISRSLATAAKVKHSQRASYLNMKQHIDVDLTHGFKRFLSNFGREIEKSKSVRI